MTYAVGARGLHVLDVFEEGLHQRSVRRVEHDERNVLSPLGPLLLHGLGG